MSSVVQLSIVRLESEQYFFRLERPAPARQSQALSTPTSLIGRTTVDAALRTRLEATIEATIDELRTLRSHATPSGSPPASAATAQLESLGRFLFNFLLPYSFHAPLRALPENQALILATNDNRLPWELLHDGVQFLALKHPTGRQLLSPTPASLAAGRSQRERPFLFIDNPTKDLPGTSEEVSDLIDACDLAMDDIVAKRLSQVRADKAGVLQALSSGVYDVIHYAGHAVPDRLLLADGELTIEEIGQVLNGRPVIFLNACQSAAGDQAEGESEQLPLAGANLQNLADAFLSNGAAAFIGSLWEVYDASSRDFAGWFYALALKGIPIGEALRQTRARMQAVHPHDPLWASFVLYGDPTRRIVGIKQRETRPVTVLYARLAGLLRLFEQVQLEPAVRLQTQLFTQLAEIGGRFGGSIEGHLGGAMCFQFGIPQTHEDDAERAVRAALEMVQQVRDFNAQRAGQLPGPIEIRVGISTGTVIGEQRPEAGYQFAGPVVDLAAVLARHAGDDQVWIDATTYRLVQEAFDCAPSPALTLAERAESIVARRVLGARESQIPAGSIIGRTNELSQLENWWREATAGRGCLVSIVGPAGVGKTRLVHAFQAKLARHHHRWIGAACQSHQRTTPYALLGQLIRGLAGIAAQDNDATRREKLGQLIHRAFPDAGARPEERHREGIALLGQVIGLKIAAPTIDTLDPELRQRKLISFIRAVLQGEANQQPLVVTLEDLHWVDEASLSVLNQILGSIDHAPVLVLAIYRPEWSNQWDHRGHYHRLTLNDLDPDARRALLLNLLGRDAPDAQLERILNQTAGNPFFIKEMVRSLQESGLLVRSNHAWELTGDLTQTPLPNRVENIILARLGRLSAESRDVLQKAAVIGDEFERPVLETMQDETTRARLDQTLDALHRRELISSGTGVHPDLTYHFQHSLICQVAYENLLAERRRTLHRQVALALERQYGTGNTAVLNQLARHYYRSDDRIHAIIYGLQAAKNNAAEWSNQTAVEQYEHVLEKVHSFEQRPLTQTERERGGAGAQIEQWHVQALEGKADVLAALGNSEGAVDIYRAALELAAGAEAFLSTQRADLYRKMAIAYQNRGEFDAAEEALQAGLALLDGLSCLEAGRLHIWTGLLHYRRGRPLEALSACEHAITIVKQADNVRDLAQAYNLRGLVYHELGRDREAIQDHEQSIRLYESIQYLPGLDRAYSNLACVYHDQSRWDEALRFFERSERLSARVGEARRQAAAAINLGEIYRRKGALEDAIRRFEQARQIGEAVEFPEYVGIALMNLGAAHLKQRALSEAQAFLEESLAIYRRIQADVHVPEVLRYLAELYLLQADVDQALESARKALARAEQLKNQLEMAQAHQILGRVRSALGKHEAAENDLDRSLEMLTALDSRYELGLTLVAWAELCRTRAGEAGVDRQVFLKRGRDYCRRALDIFEALGAGRDLEKGRQLLERLEGREGE